MACVVLYKEKKVTAVASEETSPVIKNVFLTFVDARVEDDDNLDGSEFSFLAKIKILEEIK